MEDKFHLNNCGEDDVLSFDSAMFKVCKLSKEVNELLSEYKLGEQISKSLGSKNISINVGGKSCGRDFRWFYEKWFTDGVDCEILKLGAEGWQKGKVRIKLKVSLEFCPDEPEIAQPESPLDDIRRMMKENS